MILLRLSIAALISAVLCACAAAPPVSTSAARSVLLDAAVYKLAAGDVVRVDVLGEADLSLQVLIDPAGFINYPFLGNVQAAGLTVRELQNRVADGLKAGYLVNPDVRVAVTQYRPIYVSGQVRQTGTYPYSQGLTVGKVLTLAGGVTQFGSTSRIYIQRAGQSKETRENVGLDASVYPGDVIVVEERLF